VRHKKERAAAAGLIAFLIGLARARASRHVNIVCDFFFQAANEAFDLHEFRHLFDLKQIARTALASLCAKREMPKPITL
jgi:hypothetical protein